MTSAKICTSKLRRIRRMTQGTLAKRACLSKTTISNLEVGHPSKIGLDTIAKLCFALECTPSDLIELEVNDQEKLYAEQKAALSSFLGVLEYDKQFNPKNLDSELAKIIEKKVRRSH